jgi:hypothetical protein
MINNGLLREASYWFYVIPINETTNIDINKAFTRGYTNLVKRIIPRVDPAWLIDLRYDDLITNDHIRLFSLLSRYKDYNPTMSFWIRQSVHHNALNIFKYLSNAHLLDDRHLISASKTGNLKMIKHILQLSSTLINVGGGLSLINAIEERYIKIVKYLIDKGVNVHYDREMSLITSIYRNALLIAKMLLKAGSNVNYNRGEPLITAINFKRPDMVKLFLKYGADPNLDGRKAYKIAKGEIEEILDRHRDMLQRE